jgi:hypothetical protein
METKTRLSILRTLGALHSEPLHYDLDTLRAIIAHLAPDLVCVDITRVVWENGDLTKASLEVREALVPVIQQTDSVLVPVAPTSNQFSDYQASSGWRRGLSQTFDGWLKWGQRKANSPEAIHGLAFETFCHTVCALDRADLVQSKSGCAPGPKRGAGRQYHPSHSPRSRQACFGRNSVPMATHFGTDIKEESRVA